MVILLFVLSRVSQQANVNKARGFQNNKSLYETALRLRSARGNIGEKKFWVVVTVTGLVGKRGWGLRQNWRWRVCHNAGGDRGLGLGDGWGWSLSQSAGWNRCGRVAL